MRRYTPLSASPFRYFNSSPAVIRLAVLMHVRLYLSHRKVDDLLFERGIGIFTIGCGRPSVMPRRDQAARRLGLGAVVRRSATVS